MSCNMLHTAVVPVYRHPVVQLVHCGKFIVVVRIDIAQEIPGRTCPLRHCIGLTLCIAAALRAFAVYEGIDLCKR